MTKIKLVKILGFLGSLASAAAAALGGDYVTAAGILSASLGSASAFQGGR